MDSTISDDSRENIEQFLIEQRILNCFPGVSERFYKREYYSNHNGDLTGDLLLLCHSNRYFNFYFKEKFNL